MSLLSHDIYKLLVKTSQISLTDSLTTMRLLPMNSHSVIIQFFLFVQLYLDKKNKKYIIVVRCWFLMDLTIKLMIVSIVLPWLPQGFANIIYSNCQVTVTLQLLKMTLESVETSSKSFIIIINFIVKSIRNQHLIRSTDIWIIYCDRELATSKTPSHHRLTKSTSRILVSC